jgi:hypothetical protein
VSTTRPRPFWPFFLACLGLFAGTNFAIAPLMDWLSPHDFAAWLVFACVGAIGAQAALHAVWCVFAPTGFGKRLTVGVGSGLALFGAWSLGYAVFVYYEPYCRAEYWETIRISLLCLPLLVIAIQSPLWMARFWLGWRILHRADPFRRSGVEAFGIRDILAATGALAVALSAARIAMPPESAAAGRFPLALGIGALVAAAISLFTTLPAVAAILRARRVGLALLGTAVLDAVIGAGLLEIGTVPPPPVSQERGDSQTDCVFEP